MRIWVDPLKLRSYNLTIADVSTAVSAQNAQVSAGQIGQLPASKEQQLNATVSVQSRLQTPEQFGNIRLRTTEGGAVVRLREDRKSVVSGKSVSVRVDLGGRRLIKKKKKYHS